MSQLAVIAIGGNSLIKRRDKQSVEDQYQALCETMDHVADVIAKGWQVLITHGNGPQVGFIMLRSEIARAHSGIHIVPLVSCVADTQGAIGYQIQQALDNVLIKRGLLDKAGKTVTVVTQVAVDPNDPKMLAPDKFVGEFYDADQIENLKTQHPDWQLKEDSNRGWRRVVPSPKPKKIVELAAIKTLLAAGYNVVAVGGGGIPVMDTADGYQGVDAVIDKDLASALLARNLDADLLVISTGVDQVAINFGKPNEEKLSTVTAKQAEAYYQAGHFPAGSMGPKVRAAIDFINDGGKEVVITSPEFLDQALARSTGTHIVKEL